MKACGGRARETSRLVTYMTATRCTGPPQGVKGVTGAAIIRRWVACLLIAAFASLPAQAFAPLVLLAKEMAKQFIRNFIEGRIDDAIRASFGPCKRDIAQDVIQRRRQLTGPLEGGGGPMPGIGGLASLGNLGAAMGALRGAGGAMGGGAINPGNIPSMADMAAAAGNSRVASVAQAAGRAQEGEQVVEQASSVIAKASSAADQVSSAADRVAGATAEVQAAAGTAGIAGISTGAHPGGMPGMPMGAGPGGIDMQAAMSMMQQMMSGPPLSPAEFDDLIVKLVRWGKVSEAVYPGTGCSEEDYRRLLGRASVTAARDPRGGAMYGGMLRMIYTTFQDMEQKFARADELFLQMTPQDRADYVETMSADLKSGVPENRRAFLAILDQGLLHPPQDMLAALRQQLAD
jgi:hypothetical protein